MKASGVLDGDTVHVMDTAQANRLHNKGFVGAPETGNSLRLTIVEALHCIHADRLRVEGHDAVSLLQLAATHGEQTEIEHLAYHDLRERGLVVRPTGTGGYHVWKRGEGPKNEPWFTTRVFAERAPVTPEQLADGPGDMVSVVDEDGGVIHYEVKALAPAGKVHIQDLPTGDAAVLDDRVLVTSSKLVEALATEFIGTTHPSGRLLSLTEAEALRNRGVLALDAKFPVYAAERQPHFGPTVAAYEALRSAGIVARSGFRFGTHLRAYSDNPDSVHAEWLVQSATAEQALAWSDLSRAIRLAHGVRKTFIVAAGDPVQFTALSWFRP